MNKKDHKTLKKVELTEEERDAIKKMERREMVLDFAVLVLALIAAILATVFITRNAPQ